ncbi:MAG: outer membrane protein assembly factor BamD [Alphaproteobacteria bacterium]|nr:outer membrane protein assembly factor BamD [Alphaproteobacteria bacterium]
MNFAHRRPARQLRLVAAAGVLALALWGCSSSNDLPYVERPVEDIYNEAVDTISERRYFKASQLFEEVERQHPYSAWATKAQLMAAYAHYQNNNYDQALIAVNRFIELHPSNRDVGYAYYLKALCYYERITDVGRDQKMTDDALNALQEVVRRFPESRYARDARLKIDLTRDHLAGKEMEIGRFYLRRGQYLAAINRFRRVVEEFQTTSHVPEALHRLTEAYLALGVRDEAVAAAAVLGHNYPGSDWYQDSYAMLGGPSGLPTGKGVSAEETSWFRRAVRTIF